MRISDWSSDVCSSDLLQDRLLRSRPRIRIGRSSGRVAHAARAHDHARRGLLRARRPLSAPSVREKWKRAAGGEFPLVEEPKMSLPTVIHSRVAPAAVHKVTRLFNNTLGDILSALIQNSGRAVARADGPHNIKTKEAQ